MSSSRELSDVLRGVIDRDVQRGSAAKSGPKPPTYAAAAAQAPASPAPPNDPSGTAIVRYVPPSPADAPSLPSPTAHAAAVQAAATQADPQSAANAYAALYAHGACDRDRMRGLGYRSCAAGRDIYMSNRAGVTCTIGWRGRAGTEERYRRRTHLPPAGTRASSAPQLRTAARTHGRGSASSMRDRLTFCEY